MDMRGRRRRQRPRCLLDLGPDLLGRVLSALPSGIGNARLACRALDDASRKHAGCAGTLKLSRLILASTEATAAPPQLSRFGAANRLVVKGFQNSGHCALLTTTLAAAGGGALGSVEEVDARRCDGLCAATWTAILGVVPGTSVVKVPWDRDAGNVPPVLAAVTSGAPNLAELRARSWDLDARGAALLASAAPRLRSLKSSKLTGSGPAAAAWAALPCTRLTLLSFSSPQPLPPAVAAAGVSWPLMQSLRQAGAAAVTANHLRSSALRTPPRSSHPIV